MTVCHAAGQRPTIRFQLIPYCRQAVLVDVSVLTMGYQKSGIKVRSALSVARSIDSTACIKNINTYLTNDQRRNQCNQDPMIVLSTIVSLIPLKN